jgi:MFS family permease
MFFALFYLQNILRVNAHTSNVILAVAMVSAIPLYPLCGALSDRIGRKKIMMSGLLLAVVFFLPIYKAMQHAAGNSVVAVSSAKDSVTGDIRLTPLTRGSDNGALVPAPEAPHPNEMALILLVFIQNVFSIMLYGPLAAYLVEAFPARIRYTSVSLPYHIGNGVFGGLLPVIGVSLCASTGNIYAGLIFPIAVAALTLVVGTIFLRESHGTMIWEEVTKPDENVLTIPASISLSVE